MSYHQAVMRINPLVVPLMVVLTAPFALGIAKTSSLDENGGSVNSHKAYDAICTGCTATTQIYKEQAVVDMGCGFATGGQYQYLLQTAYCQKFACSNGYYYTFSGWTSTNTCLDQGETTTPCPTGTCSQSK